MDAAEKEGVCHLRGQRGSVFKVSEWGAILCAQAKGRRRKQIVRDTTPALQMALQGGVKECAPASNWRACADCKRRRASTSSESSAGGGGPAAAVAAVAS